jgi:hypothetical protein
MYTLYFDQHDKAMLTDSLYLFNDHLSSAGFMNSPWWTFQTWHVTAEGLHWQQWSQVGIASLKV